jgi:hypothetical protein
MKILLLTVTLLASMVSSTFSSELQGPIDEACENGFAEYSEKVVNKCRALANTKNQEGLSFEQVIHATCTAFVEEKRSTGRAFSCYQGAVSVLSKSLITYQVAQIACEMAAEASDRHQSENGYNCYNQTFNHIIK